MRHGARGVRLAPAWKRPVVVYLQHTTPPHAWIQEQAFRRRADEGGGRRLTQPARREAHAILTLPP
jgi:hypothetical protein